jgi:hypothetical protein
MMGVSEGQGRQSCTDAGLLLRKTVVEEVLSIEEQQVLDEHLNQCKRCKNLALLTSGLPFFADASLDVASDASLNSDFNAHIAAVMEGLCRERRAARNRKTWWAAVAVAGAIATMAIFGLSTMLE